MATNLVQPLASLDGRLRAATIGKRSVQHDVEHRLEFVDEYKGVEYVNDAKAMDLPSSCYSIECIRKPLIWISFTSPFDGDYQGLQHYQLSGVEAIIHIGPNNDLAKARLISQIPLIGRVNTIAEAVEHAMLVATSGQVVLFSPAFADFNLVPHHRDAGQQFRRAVREMRLPTWS